MSMQFVIVNGRITAEVPAHTHVRSDITDFFSTPFWDSIPDKPFDTLGSEFQVSNGELQIAGIDASKVVSGVLAEDRIPHTFTSEISVPSIKFTGFGSIKDWNNNPLIKIGEPTGVGSIEIEGAPVFIKGLSRTFMTCNVYYSTVLPELRVIDSSYPGSVIRLLRTDPLFSFIKVNTDNTSENLMELYSNGNMVILGNLQINGNNLLDSSGTTRITLGATVIVGGDLQINGNDILDSGGNVRITLGATVSISGNLSVSGSLNLGGSTVKGDGSSFYPASDGALSLGNGSYRWTMIYLKPRNPYAWYIDNGGTFRLGLGYHGSTWTHRFETASNMYFQWTFGGAEKMYLTPSGNLWIAGTLTQGSSKEFKTNIKTFDREVLPIIRKLEVKEFQWKETEEWDIGLIAEEVMKIDKSLVFFDDATPPSIRTTTLMYYLLKAIQELDRKLLELENRVLYIEKTVGVAK